MAWWNDQTKWKFRSWAMTDIVKVSSSNELWQLRTGSEFIRSKTGPSRLSSPSVQFLVCIEVGHGMVSLLSTQLEGGSLPTYRTIIVTKLSLVGFGKLWNLYRFRMVTKSLKRSQVWKWATHARSTQSGLSQYSSKRLNPQELRGFEMQRFQTCALRRSFAVLWITLLTSIEAIISSNSSNREEVITDFGQGAGDFLAMKVGWYLFFELYLSQRREFSGSATDFFIDEPSGTSGHVRI